MASTQPSSSREEDVPGTSDSAIYEANTQLVITTRKKKKISEKECKTRGFLYVEPGHYINDYKMIKTLGRGTYGTVWLAKHTKSNTYAAMKISRSSEHLCDMAMREIDILTDIHLHPHPFIVKLLDSFAYEEDSVEHVVMALETLGPDLKSVIKYSGQKFHLEVVKRITRQLLEAVNHIHKLNLVHMDIKPTNVMLAVSENDIKRLASNKDSTCSRYDIDITKANARIVAKLADFGLAIRLDEDLDSYLQPNCLFRAPEQILTTKVDAAVDIWSLGCVIFQMVAASYLFSCKEYESMPDHDMCHLMLMHHFFGPINLADFRDGFREKFANKFDSDGNMTVQEMDVFLPNCYEKAIQFGMTNKEAGEFSDFLVLFFKYNKAERITAEAAIHHNYLHSDEDIWNDEEKEAPAAPPRSPDYSGADSGEEHDGAVQSPAADDNWGTFKL